MIDDINFLFKKITYKYSETQIYDMIDEEIAEYFDLTDNDIDDGEGFNGDHYSVEFNTIMKIIRYMENEEEIDITDEEEIDLVGSLMEEWDIRID